MYQSEMQNVIISLILHGLAACDAGNMDSWDPSVTDGLAQNREVILFNNAGVASSSGEVPTTFAEMAKSAGIFIDALNLTEVDVMGFSIGSMIAQNVAMQRPDLVRKLVIVGSGPRNGDGIPLTPESHKIFTNKYGNLDDFWIDGFFTASSESQAAGRAFLKRGDARVENRNTAINEKAQPAQFAALQEWGKPVGERFSYLKDIKMPVLVVGGKSNIIFDTINSFYLEQSLPKRTAYPLSGFCSWLCFSIRICSWSIRACFYEARCRETGFSASNGS
jgi:pimeloyl-ACP methyl ester carboxylesterase